MDRTHLSVIVIHSPATYAASQLSFLLMRVSYNLCHGRIQEICQGGFRTYMYLEFQGGGVKTLQFWVFKGQNKKICRVGGRVM